MDAESFRAFCLAKPAVTEGTPFGKDVLVFKVAGKMFALLALDEVPPAVNLKCNPDLALELRDRYEQVRPGYHMNKKHWNTIQLESGVPDAELRKMIDHSYDLVAQSVAKSRAAAPRSGRASQSRNTTSTGAGGARPRRFPNAKRHERR